MAGRPLRSWPGKKLFLDDLVSVLLLVPESTNGGHSIAKSIIWNPEAGTLGKP
jgi:hypothetical protein